jgi:hypothetical protein
MQRLHVQHTSPFSAMHTHDSIIDLLIQTQHATLQFNTNTRLLPKPTAIVQKRVAGKSAESPLTAHAPNAADVFHWNDTGEGSTCASWVLFS